MKLACRAPRRGRVPRVVVETMLQYTPRHNPPVRCPRCSVARFALDDPTDQYGWYLRRCRRCPRSAGWLLP